MLVSMSTLVQRPRPSLGWDVNKEGNWLHDGRSVLRPGICPHSHSGSPRRLLTRPNNITHSSHILIVVLSVVSALLNINIAKASAISLPCAFDYRILCFRPIAPRNSSRPRIIHAGTIFPCKWEAADQR